MLICHRYSGVPGMSLSLALGSPLKGGLAGHVSSESSHLKPSNELRVQLNSRNGVKGAPANLGPYIDRPPVPSPVVMSPP